MQNKIKFTVGTGEDAKEYAVLRPTPKVLAESQKVYNRVFRESVESGAILRAEIDNIMRNRNLWDEEKQKKLKELIDGLSENEKALSEGRKMRLSEAKKLALKMREQRAEIQDMLGERNRLDNNSAEAQAENMKFNFLVSKCTVYNTNGEPVFKSLDDYMEKNSDEVAIQAATCLAKMIYNYDDDREKGLPENKFLAKFGFVNEKLHLVDKQGRLIDEEGRLIDENGRFINEEGKFVDINGNLVDEEGRPVVEYVGFVDDETGELVM